MTDRQRVRILVVEDNVDDTELARRVLERCGVLQDAHFIKDGADAADYIFGTGPFANQGIPKALKLILLDLHLPRIPGMDLLRRIKANQLTQSIVTVMLTASETENDVLKSYNFGSNSYMLKPIEVDRFQHIYNTFLRDG